jgi:hypothetical protein
MSTETKLSRNAREILDGLGITVHRVDGGLVHLGDEQGGPYDDPVPTVAQVEAACEDADARGGTVAYRFEAFHDALAGR